MVFRVSPTSIPHKAACLRVERTRKTGNGGDGHKSEWGVSRSDIQGPSQGLAAVSSHT